MVRNEPTKEIAFCIHVCDRLWQLRQTLPKNLEDNRASSGKLEFVLCDFGSSDGLLEYVVSNFKRELATGYLKLFSFQRMDAYHISYAKNAAHLLASARILVNLDADNFTGPDGAEFVLNRFASGSRIVHQFSGNFKDGSCGRIACFADDFKNVGGYDAQLEPLGYDDLDLIQRLEQCTGVESDRQPDSRFNAAVPNDKGLSQSSESDGNSYSRWVQMNGRNSLRSLLQQCLIGPKLKVRHYDNATYMRIYPDSSESGSIRLPRRRSELNDFSANLYKILLRTRRYYEWILRFIMKMRIMMAR